MIVLAPCSRHLNMVLRYDNCTILRMAAAYLSAEIKILSFKHEVLVGFQISANELP
jgi:hypothetical protein